MRRTMGALILLGLIGAVVCGHGLALASDPEPTSVTAVGIPQHPAIAYNDRMNEYLMVWSEDRGLGTGLDLYGLRLNSSGGTRGSDFPVVIAPGDQVSPTLAFDSRDNQYLVVWSEILHFDSGYDLFGQRLSGAGRPTGYSFSMVVWPSDLTAPDLAYDVRQDEFFLVWEDNRNAPDTGVDIFGQRFKSRTRPIPKASSFPVVAIAGHQTSPDAAYNRDSGGFVLVWEDDQNVAATGLDIFAKRLNANGWPYPQNVSLSAAPGDQVSPTLAYVPGQSSYVVVWVEERTPETALDLFGRRLNSVGRPRGGDFEVGVLPGNQLAPDLAFNTRNGDFLLTWNDDRYADDGLEIWGRELNRNGRPRSRDFLLVAAGR
jgi:hypothetical protein